MVVRIYFGNVFAQHNGLCILSNSLLLLFSMQHRRLFYLLSATTVRHLATGSDVNVH